MEPEKGELDLIASESVATGILLKFRNLFF